MAKQTARNGESASSAPVERAAGRRSAIVATHKHVAAPTGRKETQRERLLDGMIRVAARDGYADATIAHVIGEAGVSRPTFYDYFADKDDCFVATLAAIDELLVAHIRQAVQGEPPEHALGLAIATLIGFADSEVRMAQVLLGEAMAAGPRALDVRDRGIAEIAAIIEGAHERIKPDVASADLPSRILIGGIYRLLASRLRRGRHNTLSLCDELFWWLTDYEMPHHEHRWRTLDHAPALPRSPFLPETTPLTPRALAPGRPPLSREQVAENYRQRILFAATRLAEDTGYNATTISDITRLAGVDTRAFYRVFSDKQAAFSALHEQHFRDLMGVTAGAFFAGATWPARMWEGGRAFAQYIEQNPSLAYASFVESQAAGPVTLERLDELIRAFTVFLQEGYQHTQPSTRPSSLELDAIAATVFELNYTQAREGRVTQLSGLVPHVMFIALAPFLGPVETNTFIDQQLDVSGIRVARPDGPRRGQR